uniref:Uncharacterized protein n=1 Tax=Rhizophora mucronata TaxID=61149 RepID=A0A2P2J4C9_RHIMU
MFPLQFIKRTVYLVFMNLQLQIGDNVVCICSTLSVPS